jgi:hypothetical protein
VRDLGRRPHRVLLAGRVDHDAARLHERRDQPLLAVLTLDDDAVGAGLRDRVLDVPAGAGLAGVEDPQRGLVGAEVGVREVLLLLCMCFCAKKKRKKRIYNLTAFLSCSL